MIKYHKTSYLLVTNKKLFGESMPKIPIYESAFKIIDESEGIENDFSYSPEFVQSSNENLMQNINKDVIIEFLSLPETKLWAVKNSTGNYDIIAKNFVTNEKVRLTGLGNHFWALVKVVKQADKFYKNPNHTLLDEQFIKDINLQVLKHREGEVAIGEYRYLNYCGNPIKIIFAECVDGKKKIVADYVELEPSNRKNVYEKMKILTDWINNEAFHNPDNIMEDIARFHAEFLRIHPFLDGNGRTCRLITNYLLLTQQKPLINVPAKTKNKYLQCLNFANAKNFDGFLQESESNREFYERFKAKYGERSVTNKYKPLAKLLEQYSIVHCNDLVNEILNYKNNNLKHFSANQI